jgi:hypothetical protein
MTARRALDADAPCNTGANGFSVCAAARNPSKPPKPQMKTKSLISIIGAIVCFVSTPVHANYVAFRDGSFAGVHSLTTADGLLTVAGWANAAATTPANLGQWWWLEGVDSGTGNSALIDGQESMTLQFAPGWGASQIQFIYTGSGSTPAPITISGFLSDPGASAQTYVSPRISNLNYSSGTLTFNYAPFDSGNDLGILNFANPKASAASTLGITYGLASGGAALAQVNYVLIPEPASLSLLVLAAGMVLAVRRKLNR